MDERITARLAALERELEQFVQQANGVIASYRGGINELKRLLEPPAAAAECEVPEHPQRGPDLPMAAKDGEQAKTD